MTQISGVSGDWPGGGGGSGGGGYPVTDITYVASKCDDLPFLGPRKGGGQFAPHVSSHYVR